MEIIFLGTGSMVPTKQRNHSAILFRYKNENILFDCGEGTQRQFRKAKLKPSKITKLIISHWHGDHVLGIPGLLQTLAYSDYTKTLEIYGPTGTKKYLKTMEKSSAWEIKIKIKVNEIESGKFIDNNDFMIEAFPLKHGCKCLGYRITEKDKRKVNLKYLKKHGLSKHPILKELQQGKSIKWEGKKIDVDKATILQKGKVIGLIMDTMKFSSLEKVGENADLLISEATHLEKDREESYKHLTVKEAAENAKKSKAQKLILTHFSQRYKDTKDILKEAKTEFKNTKAAEDFMKIEL